MPFRVRASAPAGWSGPGRLTVTLTLLQVGGMYGGVGQVLHAVWPAIGVNIWVAVCLGCGFAQRYFEESEAELPAECPQCGGEMRARCPECDARFSSAFAVECEECGAALRPPTALGLQIRRDA